MSTSNASNTRRSTPRAQGMTRLGDTLADADWLKQLRAKKGLAPLPPQCDRCGTSGSDPATRDGYCSCGWGARQRKEDARVGAQLRKIREDNLTATLDRWLPKRHKTFTLDTHPLRGTPIYASVRGWLNQWDGKQSLLLRGDYGVGKTGFMIGALKLLVPRAAREKWSMRFTTTLDLFDDLQAGFRDNSYEALLSEVSSVQLLALDDLGAERASDWRQERLLAILGARYNADLPLMATTNCNAAQLREYLTPRIYSRVFEHCAVFDIVGDDLRARQQQQTPQQRGG